MNQQFYPQYLFYFPEDFNLNLQQLYDKILDYINSQNQDQLLSSQIQALKQTVTNNKTSSDQSFTNVNSQLATLSTNLSKLQSGQQNYLLIAPSDKTSLNSNYLIELVQIKDLNALRLSIKQLTDLDSLMIKSSQISDINLFALKTDLQTTDLTNYYNRQQVDQKISQIKIDPVDLSSYLKTADFSSQLAKYLLIADLDVQLQKYLLVDDYKTDRKKFLTNENMQSYVDQYFLAKFPGETTLLSSDYNIKTTQIQDLSTFMSSYATQDSLVNYYNKQQVDQKISQIQITPVDLSNYYNKQQVDQKITPVDLSKYLLASPKDTTALDSNYTIQHTQVVNLNKRYLQIVPDKYGTMLDLGYQIYTSQINDFNFQLDLYLGTNNYVNNKNKGIYFKDYVQFTDLKDYVQTKDLANYVQFTDLANYYTKAQVDQKIQSSSGSSGSGGNADLLKYMLINPGSTTLTDTNYKFQVIQITDIDIYIKNQQFVKNNQYQSDLKNYLKSNITQMTALSPFYTITTGQITDMDSYMVNYVSKADMLNLKNYMKDNITATTPINSFYTISYKQISDLSQFNSNYVTVQFLNQQLAMYYPSSPPQKTLIDPKYSILLSQVSDFDTQIKKYLPSGSGGTQDLSKYMLLNPTLGNIELDSHYFVTEKNIQPKAINNFHIQDATISGSKIGFGTITYGQMGNNSVGETQVQKQAIKYQHLNKELRNMFVVGQSQSVCDTVQYTTSCSTEQNLKLPCGFLNITKYTYNQTQQYLSTSFFGPATSLLNSFINFSNFDLENQSSSFVQFSDNVFAGGEGGPGFFGLSYTSTQTLPGSKIGPMFDGFSPGCKVTVGGAKKIQAFVSNSNPGYCVSYITNLGQYLINCDENLKDSIQPKTNYQEQLNKLLKLDIVTYSYGKQFSKQLKKNQEKLNDQNLSQEEREYIQQQILDLQQASSKCIQGYTYQNLLECGFDYVLQAKQIMSDQYLEQKKFDKEKVKESLKAQQTKTINETAMIPYLILGIKGLNEKIEQHNQRLDVIDQAMMKTHEIINEVSCQTDQKIQDVQQNSLLNSINSDNIDEIKNTLNKLIYKFDQQQNVIKKYQTQIVFLHSQCEQMQSTIEKQQTDITNLKLKTKLTN